MTAKKDVEALNRRAKTRQAVARIESKLYRQRNKAEYNAKARERMARKRASMTEPEREESQEKQRVYSKKYYEQNRNDILDKAETRRYREYESLYGRDSFNRNYRFRDVKPREVLNMEKGSNEYNTAMEEWQTAKAERIERLKRA